MCMRRGDHAPFGCVRARGGTAHLGTHVCDDCEWFGRKKVRPRAARAGVRGMVAVAHGFHRHGRNIRNLSNCRTALRRVVCRVRSVCATLGARTPHQRDGRWARRRRTILPLLCTPTARACMVGHMPRARRPRTHAHRRALRLCGTKTSLERATRHTPRMFSRRTYCTRIHQHVPRARRPRRHARRRLGATRRCPRPNIKLPAIGVPTAHSCTLQHKC